VDVRSTRTSLKISQHGIKKQVKIITFIVGNREPTIYVTFFFAENKITFSKSDRNSLSEDMKRPLLQKERNIIIKRKYWRKNPVELGPSLSGFLDKFASFPRMVCQTNVLNPLLRKGKISKHYPGIEPSTFGVAVGDANHYAIQVAT
jgi:hypothetical protein